MRYSVQTNPATATTMHALAACMVATKAFVRDPRTADDYRQGPVIPVGAGG